MLKTISATGSDVVKVEDYSKGLVLTNIRKDSTIKIDLVSTKGVDRNVLPSMTIQEYSEMLVSITPREQILVSDGVAYERVTVLFSVAGALPLNDDEYYNVSLGNLNNRTIQVHNLDDLVIAPFTRALQVDRVDIKASLSEKLVSTAGYAFAFFPNDKPSKIETQSGNRKVTFESAQIQLFNDENRIISQDTVDLNPATYDLGTDLWSFLVAQTNDITIHKAGTEMIFYLVSA